MELKYGLTGDERKTFVKAVADIIGAESRYLGVPSCAYAVGEHYTITRDGTLEISDDADAKETERLISELKERGYTAENADEIELVILGVDEGDDTPEGFSIGMPLTEISGNEFSEDTLERFRALVSSYEELFKKTMGTTSLLRTETEDGSVWFDWFDHISSKAQIAIYTDFIKALYRFAENAKRVNGRHSEVENEKFTMRTFLNRIGLSGAEYKPLRRELMKNLSGNSAYRYGKPPEDTE